MKDKSRRDGKGRRCWLGDGIDSIPCCTSVSILHQDDLKKKMNIRMDTRRNVCFGKMNDQPVLTTPNHYPPNMNVLQKLFFDSSLLLNG